MSARGEAVVAEARRWLGTPYRHQGSVRGAGCDCLGLLRGIWRALYGQEPEHVPAYTMDWSEPGRDEALWRAARRHLVVCPDGAAERAGQVLLFRMRGAGVAKHLGIISQHRGAVRFIHAYSGHGVVENHLTGPWARRVVARFEFP